MLWQKKITLWSFFLDDLQWADFETLRLLQNLITDPETHYLFLIGAYRDNQVNATHPLMITLEAIQKATIIVNTLTLPPLTNFQVKQIVSETLQVKIEKASPLAMLIFQKTLGNPFFVKQFLTMLYKDSLLTFSSLSNETKKTSGWQWDLTKIQKMDITDNVVTLMTQKVENLSAKAQHILKLAACIGNQFDLQTLTIINEKSLKETAKELWEVIEEGLIEVFEGYQLVLTGEISPHSVNCKFLHDQIQQVAYSLITKANKTKLHLKIGRLMLANKPEMKHDETIF